MRQDMTVAEVMEYQGRLYNMPRKERRDKAEGLLDFADLLRFRNRTVRHLSGGMKRKLMICRGLLIDPEIMLLDEPTAGMDALSRRQMWTLLRQINDRDLTIVLTTHYMEEAENLCERIALINKGKLDTIDSPANLIRELGGYAVDEMVDGELKSRFFANRKDAIAFLETASADASLRTSTLEDVFVERIGSRLMKR